MKTRFVRRLLVIGFAAFFVVLLNGFARTNTLAFEIFPAGTIAIGHGVAFVNLSETFRSTRWASRFAGSYWARR